MPVEIERVFRVAEMPAIDVGTARRIRQGYLVVGDDGAAARVRWTAFADGRQRAMLTVKRGLGTVRQEVEISLEAAQAEALWPMTAGRRVEKVRHPVLLRDTRVAEVDVFAGDLAGLVLVEVEFSDVEAAQAFVPPVWFGTEVTGDLRFRNQHLAEHGIV